MGVDWLVRPVRETLGHSRQVHALNEGPMGLPSVQVPRVGAGPSTASGERTTAVLKETGITRSASWQDNYVRTVRLD